MARPRAPWRCRGHRLGAHATGSGDSPHPPPLTTPGDSADPPLAGDDVDPCLRSAPSPASARIRPSPSADSPVAALLFPTGDGDNPDLAPRLLTRRAAPPHRQHRHRPPPPRARPPARKSARMAAMWGGNREEYEQQQYEQPWRPRGQPFPDQHSWWPMRTTM